MAEQRSAGNYNPSFRFAFWAAIGVVAAVTVLFRFEGAVGFSLADEGYLWYGAQRVLLGEVPIRDFMSYDPGRYYWSAAFMGLFDDNGILSLRISVAIFQFMGLMVAAQLLRRAAPRAPLIFLCLAIATLLVWMVPRHKLFDITIAIFLIAALAHLIEQPTNARYFLMGVVVGAAAIFGRNHGVYGLIASLAAAGVLAWRHQGPRLFRALPALAAGVCIGFMPMLIAFLAVPGLLEAFWADVRLVFEYGGTNLALPVPWPWTAETWSGPWIEGVRRATIGLSFVGVLAFALLGPAYVLLAKPERTNPTFAAAAFLALPYAHFAFSRADVFHLAQGVLPLLIGILTAPCVRSERSRFALTGGLLVASLLVAGPIHPGWVAWRAGNWQTVELGQDRLTVSPAIARDLSLVQELVNRYAPKGGAFMVTPYWPGVYAAFGRKAPNWEIYALFPRSVAFQKAEIARIRAAEPGLVAVVDSGMAGLDELRYRNTHPLIHEFIVENFLPVTDLLIPSAIQVYKARQQNGHP